VSKKIGRNDPCFCGSGKKYKRCHLNRQDENRLPFEAIRSTTLKSGKHKICLHPHASTENCNKIISSHTLQRSRVLKEIVDESNHVFTFYPLELDDMGDIKLHEVGWQNASTSQLFCEHHDSTTFAPLEQTSFSASKEQIFLIAYRALCWELYRKSAAIRSGPTLRDLIDRGSSLEAQKFTQDFLKIQQSGFKKGIESLNQIKQEFDYYLLNKGSYSPFKAVEILMSGSMSIAATGAINPNLSLDGKTLQVLHSDDSDLQWLAFGVDISHRGVSVLFLWYEKDKAPNEYIDSILRLDNKDLSNFIAQFFFAHCENTYFSKAWWCSLDSSKQSFIKTLAANTNPYYYLPQYDFQLQLTPWKILNVTNIEG